LLKINKETQFKIFLMKNNVIIITNQWILIIFKEIKIGHDCQYTTTCLYYAFIFYGIYNKGVWGSW